MSRRAVEATGRGVRLAGWVDDADTGAPVLLLHGGPGLGHAYLDGLVEELSPAFRVACFQQRGLSPSSEEGPFAVSDHVADVALFLDALGWDRTLLVGHSWGGHLALHVAAAMPDRLLGVLAVDPLGAVGDGGAAEFEAEMAARTPPEARERAEELDARAMRGEGTDTDALESLRLVWPAYFPTPETAPEMPPTTLSVPCYSGTWESLTEELPRLEAALPSIRVPVGFVAGAASPMPRTASTDAADRIPGAWTDVVDGAGHFPWLDVPGSVRTALDRLVRSTETGSWGPAPAR